MIIDDVIEFIQEKHREASFILSWLPIKKTACENDKALRLALEFAFDGFVRLHEENEMYAPEEVKEFRQALIDYGDERECEFWIAKKEKQIKADKLDPEEEKFWAGYAPTVEDD